VRTSGSERRDGGTTHRPADHLHNFQVCIFLHSPILEQLHTLDNDRVSGFTSVLSLAVGSAMNRNNPRRFTPTANVCREPLERAQEGRWCYGPRCIRPLSTYSSRTGPPLPFGHRVSSQRGGCRCRPQKVLWWLSSWARWMLRGRTDHLLSRRWSSNLAVRLSQVSSRSF